MPVALTDQQKKILEIATSVKEKVAKKAWKRH
jgi:hypothetical protein